MNPSVGLFLNAISVRFPDHALAGGEPVEGAVRKPDQAVAASLQDAQAVATKDTGADRAVATHVAYLPRDPGCEVGDQVLYRGRTYRVLGPAEDLAGRGVAWAIRLERTT